MADSPTPSYRQPERTPRRLAHKDELCAKCATIDFDRYLNEELPEIVHLGTWTRVRRSGNCPFCRLVVHGLKSTAKLGQLEKVTEVVLSNSPSWELGIEMSPHDRRKSESYSNKFDLRSKARQCPEMAFRFVVCARGGCQELKAFIQYLAHADEQEQSRCFFGRKIGGDRTDIELLKSWLSICRTRHGNECERHNTVRSDLPINLRLIDVVNWCIVKATEIELQDYVALSYVWGVEQMKEKTGMAPVMLERKNLRTGRDIEMTPLPRRLPKTIDDAIRLTDSLGFQYLWVDALCIIQDDADEEKNKHLSRMDTVYDCAALTIAAAAGCHADYGLPGIGIGRKQSQYTARVQGLRLATMFPAYSDLENSGSLVWNTRGWTFQEKLLSKRILLVTDAQIYWKCSESIWTEEIIMETETLSKSVEARRGKYRWPPEPVLADGTNRMPNGLVRRLLSPQIKSKDEWEYFGRFLDYASAVREYTTRTLSDSKDAIFAINGVLGPLEPSLGQFFLGLPENHFLESLLWLPEPGSIHTRTDNKGLPSWTWASWRFEKKWASYETVDVRSIHSIFKSSAIFHALPLADPGFEPATLSDFAEFDPNNLAYYTGFDPTNPLTYLKLSGETETIRPGLYKTFGNLIACFGYSMLLRDNTVKRLYYCEKGSGQQLKFRHPNYAFLFSSLRESRDIKKNPDCRDATTVAMGLADVPFLRINTVTVKFRVGRLLTTSEDPSENEVGIYELLDASYRCVGELWTTRRGARSGGNKPREFLTISWGLDLKNAKVHRDLIPRWEYDGDRTDEPTDENDTIRKAIDTGVLGPLAEALHLRLTMKDLENVAGGHASASVDPLIQNTARMLGLSSKPEASPGGEGSTAGSLYVAALTAKKGAPQPRALWTVVNLIMVERDGGAVRRCGVGKVLTKAWVLARDRDGGTETVKFV